MRFAHPVALFAAIAVPWIWWVAVKQRRPGQRRLVWRLLTLALLTCAAAGLEISTGEAPMAVVVALDRSASVPVSVQQQDVERVNALATTMHGGDRLGVVVFGADASLELRPSEAPRLSIVRGTVSSSGTDIGGAIRLARAVLPPGGSRRIVLVSDGRDTLGTAERDARSVASSGIPIDVVPSSSATSGEPLRVTRVMARENVSAGEPFLVSIEVSGSPGARGGVVVYRDDEPVARSDVTLGADGTGRATLSERQDQAGTYVYRAMAEAEEIAGETPSAGAVVVVEGTPGVLYVTSSSIALDGPLADAGFRVTRARPEQVPTTARALSAFGVVVLDDVASDQLGAASMSALASYVEQEGGGLLMLGSARTLVGGGYPVTPLEPILPIDLRPRNGNRTTALELVLVFDRSGSMADASDGVPKIEVARQAVMTAFSVMPSSDAIGVLAFDSVPQTVVPLTTARDADALRAALQRVTPGGSTAIAPALDMAYRWLLAPDRPQGTQRQILLVSDGRTSDADAARMQSLAQTRGVVLSVVAIGPNANRPLLQRLAATSGGRAYFPDNVRDLPRAVAREAMRSSGGGVVEELFLPEATVHPILANIDVAKLPRLGGYVVSTAKPTATAILASHLGDPVLAAWRAGLGRAAVFSADLSSSWSASLRAWPEERRLWTQTLRWLSRDETDPVLRVVIREVGGRPRIEADLDGPEGARPVLDVAAVLTRLPAAPGEPVALEPIAPGRYEADLPVTLAGPYVVAVTAREPGSAVEHRVVRTLYWSSEREGQARGTDLRFLSQLAAATGGRVLDTYESPFDAPRPSGHRDVSMWAALAALALFVSGLVVGNY